MTLATRIPGYPWDRLAPLREKARAFPGGHVDLSIGTPVDPVPSVVRRALVSAADSPGYPLTAGTGELRSAAAGWLRRCLGVAVPAESVLPVIGTKEFIAWLPTMLGLGAGDAVAHPALAYPTYDIGARLAGATPLGTGSVPPGENVRLLWVNSPSNPTGRVMSSAELRTAVSWARANGAVLASDECYITLGWDSSPVSVLHPSASGGSVEGVLAVYSLSKRSNMAGYRSGFVVGDPALIAALLAVRRQAGMIVPQPVQAAMAAALKDDAHAEAQRETYRARRTALLGAVRAAGFRVDHSEAGLYLWAAHPDHDCWSACELLASQCGILAGPGEMYGPSGSGHVRLALTATDERIAAAAERLRRLTA